MITFVKKIDNMELAGGIAGIANNESSLHKIIKEFSESVEKQYYEKKTFAQQPANVKTEGYGSWIRDWIKDEVLNPNNPSQCQKDMRCKWSVRNI